MKRIPGGRGGEATPFETGERRVGRRCAGISARFASACARTVFHLTSDTNILSFSSASRFLMKLFEQTAQRERRAFGPVGHDRCDQIVRSIDFPR